MKDAILHCIENLEESILELEAPGGTVSAQQVLDQLGISHAKLSSAQVIAVLDMLVDGITPVTPEMVTALLGVCEAHKRFLYTLAGFLQDGAAQMQAARAEELPLEDAGPVPEAAEEDAPGSAADAPGDDTPEGDSEPEDDSGDDSDDGPAPAPRAGQPARQQAISSIRVPTDRLDRLIELVGKLMVTYAVITAHSGNAGGAGKSAAASLRELDTVIGSLQAEVDAIRLVPLKQIFMPMHRLVKSLSQKVGKKVEFTVTGDDLALDKTIVEYLNEPLVHLLRNSVDHGLETPEERAAAGKPEAGRVRLAAWRKGETAYVSVSDDGRGLDPERIRAKAVDRGLLDPEGEYSREEILRCVLQSGFSTAEAITDVSGRGVGMDAVVNVIRTTLDGDVDIDSEPGKGAEFTLRIPLSRSANEGIVDALVCRIGSEVFIIPSRDVVEIYVPREKDVVQLPGGRETCDVRGEVHSLLRLGDYLGLSGGLEDLTRAQTVVVRVGEYKAALLVDEVLRQQQVVITGFTVPVQELYGLPILGYGMMGESDAWVVDTETLLQSFSPQEQAAD